MRASVLIPTHNRCEMLLKTLTTLEQQTLAPASYEVVVCVDGFGDPVCDALERLRTPYPFRFIVQANSGIAAARNFAARVAQHEILVFLDDDQLACPELLQTHLDIHARGQEVLVQGPYPLADGYDRRGASLIYDQTLLATMRSIASSGATAWLLWGNNFSVPAATFEKAGGFDVRFRDYGGEDTDFGLRLSAMGIPFIYEPRAITRHMHYVSQASFRRQSFSSGRALVEVANKHKLQLAEFSGVSDQRLADRVCFAAWRHTPWLVDIVGRLFSAALTFADALQTKQAQLALARIIRRVYRLGGMVQSQGSSIAASTSAIS